MPYFIALPSIHKTTILNKSAGVAVINMKVPFKTTLPPRHVSFTLVRKPF